MIFVFKKSVILALFPHHLFFVFLWFRGRRIMGLFFLCVVWNLLCPCVVCALGVDDPVDPLL